MKPIDILEAMGNGMFVITTDHAGIPDVVKNEKNGIVMGENNLAEKIYRELINIENKYLKVICRENRKYCQERFSQKNYICAMRSVFEKIDKGCK